MRFNYPQMLFLIIKSPCLFINPDRAVEPSGQKQQEWKTHRNNVRTSLRFLPGKSNSVRERASHPGAVIGRKTKEVSRNAHCSVWPLSKICIAENRFNSVSVGRIQAVVTRAGLGVASSPLSGLFPGAESRCWQGPE